MGFEQNNDTTPALMSKLNPGSLSVPAAPPSSSGTVSIDVGGIHVHGATAAEIMPLLESQIVDVFERAALEMGA
jgi:hypothetical protein